MQGHVRVSSYVEDIAEVVFFADEPVAENVEVAAGELDEVDDDGAGLLAGADGEVSGHVGGEGANASAGASASASAGASAGVSAGALVVGFRGDGCAYKLSGPPVSVPNLSLVPRSFRLSGSLSI